MSYVSITPQKDLIKFIRTRPESSIPKTIKDEIKMISFNRKSPEAKIFGSFSYIIQKYAADIDLTENFSDIGKENTIIKFEKSLLDIVRAIKKKRSHWFSEYKTGFDPRYVVDIGKISNGKYTVNPKLGNIVTKMLKDKLIKKKEAMLIRRCINETKNNPYNSDAYDVIYNIFREYKVLRWTEKEVLEKKKKLTGGVVITLREALGMKGHVKIDEIIYLNGKFLEITNFVFISYDTVINGVKQKIPLNLSEIRYEDVLIQLKDEIEKLYLSNYYYSPFKVVKRMFALGRSIYLHDKNKLINKTVAEDLEDIIPFVSSDASFLYQMKAELEAIERIFIVAKSYPKVSVNKQIEGLKIGLSNIIELNQDDIIRFNKLIDKIVSAKAKKEKKMLISELIKNLKFVINYLTINYFDKIGFNPPPIEYFPYNMKYGLIERSPTEDPQKKSKLIQLYKKL